ncbi:putative membrane protein [Yersinia ruckeri ATCC 29473]|uniref:Uncharacterized protein n=1 Tax=Yersinia ruckeri TaxID=29486 RepID=A0A085U557_YERRU|nr:hypothetical protein QMA0440_02720 [Yersinia ruckeri]KGA49600.1 putative membrane protein [Yersinia ruckeri ATCC 29473]KFE38320.1 hypothetical protein nADLYRO1b_2128 [Yersinia ruckeri]QTD75757.1 Uncharacterized protein YR821_0826 [Yersinia ruckeri]CEK26655.1 hypothetical protein CSF007_4435 [Yersinia ruckeri]
MLCLDNYSVVIVTGAFGSGFFALFVRFINNCSSELASDLISS